MCLQAIRDGEPIPLVLTLVSMQVATRLLERRAEFLHPEELARFAQLCAVRRQHSFVLGRWAAKQGIAAFHPRIAARSIRITSGVFGQPVIEGVPSPPALSLTHSSRCAAALASRAGHPVGVDLETLESEHSAAFDRILVPDERELLHRLPNRVGLGLLWTIKEALSKVLGCGFTAPVSVLQVSRIDVEPSGGFRALFANFPQFQGRAWSLGGSALCIVCPRHTEVVMSASEQQRVAAVCVPSGA